MGAAYTVYKFRKLFGLVLTIFVLLIAISMIKPLKEKATANAVKELDQSGETSAALEAANSIPDPEGEVKQSAGNFLWKLLDENLNAFFMLALIITGILFIAGVRLRDVREFIRNLR